MVPFKDLPQGIERDLRSTLRLMLNRHDGSWVTTNQEADEIASVLLTNYEIKRKH